MLPPEMEKHSKIYPWIVVDCNEKKIQIFIGKKTPIDCNLKQMQNKNPSRQSLFLLEISNSFAGLNIKNVPRI